MRTVYLSFFCALPLACRAGLVSGTVTADGRGLAGVPVSDGYEIVYTGADGCYSLETDKTLGLLFVSTPSGYEPASCHGNRPDFWRLLTTPPDEPETVDFVLRPTDDSRFAFVAMADNQISNRHGEVNCFVNTTVPDVNATVDSLRTAGLDPFVILLGDQAHDCYWKPNRYGLPQAYSDIERIDARVYSVMGNHDHDPTAMNDIDAGAEWRRFVGPEYYSFDKGGVHFVVLDDEEIVDNGPTLSKDGECVYKNKVRHPQMEWLRKDLERVAPSTPVLLAIHAPLLPSPGMEDEWRLVNGAELAALLAKFDHVEIISGHTHISYAAEKGNLYETNYGAVCGSWWLNARVDLGNDNNLCREGTPSGYAVWSYGDGKFSNYFKGTGYDRSDVMRIYDLDAIEIDNEQIAAEFAPGRKKTHDVLVNVWGYGPGWSVEMFENGRPLEVERVRSKDPLFLQSCPVPYLALGNELIGTVRPVFSWHFFKAHPRRRYTDITVRVTDRYGRTYTRTHHLPKKP